MYVQMRGKYNNGTGARKNLFSPRLAGRAPEKGMIGREPPKHNPNPIWIFAGSVKHWLWPPDMAETKLVL